MGKTVFAVILILVVMGIQSCKKTGQVEKPVIERKVESTPVQEVKTGWEDPDTYIVKVIDETEEKAVNKAKIRVLKDIINVRFKLYGKYSKIAEIKDEFDKPLKNGKVVSKRDLSGGVEIYYQVRYKNLKKMVEKKQ
jgi:hypothetical protein